MQHFLNGKIVPESGLKLPAKDLAILRGYGVFDFMRTYNNKVFLFDEHFKRLSSSAELMGLKLPYGRNYIERKITELIRLNGIRNPNIRIVLTGGCGKENMFVIIEKSHAIPDKNYHNGIKLISQEYLRDFPEAKTINYANLYKQRASMDKKGAFEVLYHSGGKLLECSTSNIFIFKNNQLITPNKNILMGCTRNFVIELARNDFKAIERDIRHNELKSAQEAFITATNKEIMPVVKIDGNNIGDGKVGEETMKLMEIFQNYINKFKQ